MLQPEQKILAVRAWPQSLSLAVQDIRSVQAVTVISVSTPITTDRTSARALVRNALCHTLAVVLDQPAASVALISRPGEAIAVDSLSVRLGLSLSHAPELSVAAICRGASVGVDLMRIEDGIEGDPDWVRVALDYLGPQATALLRATSSSECPVAFVKAWTRFEACLKCLGLALTEWSPELGKQLATCQIWTLGFVGDHSGSLVIGGGFLGSVAVLRKSILRCLPMTSASVAK